MELTPSVDYTQDSAADAPVLVAVMNDPADLARAANEGWYRIPLAHAPPRIAADYLAFYQTAAFPPGDRCLVRWCAAVRGYRLVLRRELLPAEPDHPRSDQRYYRISLGPLQALPRVVPSRRLRRIMFIATTLARLHAATEINDLWIKSPAQERLWAALKQADLEAERQYPFDDEHPEEVADFALLCRRGRAGLAVTDEPQPEPGLREPRPAGYRAGPTGWTLLRVTCAELAADPHGWAARLSALAAQMGGLAP